MEARQRRWVLGGAAAAVVAIVTAGVLVLYGEPSQGTAQGPRDDADAGEVALDFLDAFAAGDVAAAAALTDDPAAAEATLSRATARLGVTGVETRAVPPKGDESFRDFRVTWTLGAGRTWAYDNRVHVVRTGEGRRVDWTPALVHPRLRDGQALELRTGDGAPGVVDRDGRPLLDRRAGGLEPAEKAGARILLPSMSRLAAERLAAAWSVVIVDARGAEVSTVHAPAGAEAGPLVSTLSGATQRAAQTAVDEVDAPASLVAIRPSTGAILAVAQNASAGDAPTALTGLSAPGSTFKIATATAVLGSGAAGAETVLPCPGRDRIGTRTIPNDGEFDLGAVPLRTAFAHSCNTTFARLAADLPPEALADAATSLGLNADFEIPGLTTEAGRVGPAADPVQRLEDGIGQGRVQASPFGLALMAATVASGQAVTPRLWRDLDTTVVSGYEPPPAGVLADVRGMMREAVTGGTATALAGLGDVRGKTGTAQLAGPARAHGWFAGYRGDVAFAVLVEHAGTAEPSVRAAGTFLSGLPD
ncbi:penicillin-binding transpeptidase domain-containing protein [Prauserella sp. PE36]|uniref:penicillin-binding transpeptidase domain-containing protein n=1 Tax=Prauserella sp. PE36 TaxID=1504709 RepID=UPI001F3877A9|nr:penicillin-binding transpeptidase domain-containing protein [Prauserella sp. PE36]